MFKHPKNDRLTKEGRFDVACTAAGHSRAGHEDKGGGFFVKTSSRGTQGQCAKKSATRRDEAREREMKKDSSQCDSAPRP